MSAAPTDDFDFFTAGDPDYEEPAPDPAEVDRYKGLRLVKIPARQKRPTDEGWPAGHDHADVRAHVAAGGNFGVVCGDGLAIFDVDDPAMYERLCREHGVDLTGHLTVWTGGGNGRRQYLVRAPKGRRFRQVLPEYKGLEFRATRGVQCVCPSSIHRDTGLPYRWDRVSEAQLDFWMPEHDPEKWSPEMREQSRLAWEDMGPIRSLLRPAPQALLDLYSEPEETAPLVTRSEAAEPLARLKACLDQLPIRALGKAANNGVGRYTDWGSIGMALHAASGGDPAALALWIEHTKSNPEYAASAEAECTKKWKGFKLDRGSKVGMGTLVRLVQEFGGTVPPPERPSAGDVFDTVPEDEPRAESTNRFAARAIRGPEWVKLPPPPPFVDGLVGGVGVVTLFSPPGTMKTYKALDLGLRTAGALLERARRKAAPEQAAYLDEVREVHRRLEAGWHVANDQGPRRDERLENLRARATERAATATQLGLR